MKFKVQLSRYSLILTLAIIGILVAGLCATYNNPGQFITLAAITLLLLATSMCHAPLSITLNEKEININTPFKVRAIPTSRVVSVERFQPTMGSIRLRGSGGFMGYWGIFREGDAGHYMAYYGKSSDCFILRLDNGDKYVLGCEDSDKAISYIKSLLQK